MRLEEISLETVRKMTKNELHSMRARALQLWDTYFAKTQLHKAVGITRDVLINKYSILYKEIDQRGQIITFKPLDKIVIKAMMKQLDIDNLSPHVLVKNFVVTTGDFVTKPMDTTHVDWLFSSCPPEDLAKMLHTHLAEISNAIGKQMGTSRLVVKSDNTTKQMPVYDLALIPRAATSVAKMDPRIWDDTQRAEVLSIMCQMEKGNVLDMQCGHGLFLELLFRHTMPAVGIDAHDEAIDTCKRLGLDVAKHLPGTPIPYKTDEFDYVTSLHSLDNSPHQEQIITEALRVAKQKAIFILDIPGDAKTSDIVGTFMNVITKGVDLTHAMADSGMTIAPIPGTDTSVIVVLDTPIIKQRLYHTDSFFKDGVFVKKQDKEHIVTGVVYEPFVTDSQGDFAIPEEIKNAAHSFMEKAQTFGINHEKDSLTHVFDGQAIAKVLESYIAPETFSMVCTDGSVRNVVKGSWVLSVRITDDATWQAIEDGTITGFSMAGTAKIKEI